LSLKGDYAAAQWPIQPQDPSAFVKPQAGVFVGLGGVLDIERLRIKLQGYLGLPMHQIVDASHQFLAASFAFGGELGFGIGFLKIRRESVHTWGFRLERTYLFHFTPQLSVERYMTALDPGLQTSVSSAKPWVFKPGVCLDVDILSANHSPVGLILSACVQSAAIISSASFLLLSQHYPVLVHGQMAVAVW